MIDSIKSDFLGKTKGFFGLNGSECAVHANSLHPLELKFWDLIKFLWEFQEKRKYIHFAFGVNAPSQHWDFLTLHVSLITVKNSVNFVSKLVYLFSNLAKNLHPYPTMQVGFSLYLTIYLY